MKERKKSLHNRNPFFSLLSNKKKFLFLRATIKKREKPLNSPWCCIEIYLKNIYFVYNNVWITFVNSNLKCPHLNSIFYDVFVCVEFVQLHFKYCEKKIV